MKTKKPITQSSVTLTSYPKVTNEVANKSFVRKVGKVKDGSNDYVQTFLFVMQHISENMRSFTQSDLITRARPFDIPIAELLRLFELWKDEMLKHYRIEIIRGAYDEETIIFN
jgi:hypothetical protein